MGRPDDFDGRKNAHLGYVWSLQLAFAEVCPVEGGKPGMHFYISCSALQCAQALIGILCEEPPDDVSQLLHAPQLCLTIILEC